MTKIRLGETPTLPKDLFSPFITVNKNRTDYFKMKETQYCKRLSSEWKKKNPYFCLSEYNLQFSLIY